VRISRSPNSRSSELTPLLQLLVAKTQLELSGFTIKTAADFDGACAILREHFAPSSGLHLSGAILDLQLAGNTMLGLGSQRPAVESTVLFEDWMSTTAGGCDGVLGVLQSHL